MSESSPIGHGGRLTIDLAALRANWRRLAQAAECPETAAVIKADAYGCGIARAAPALWQEGCRTFFVAHLSEGVSAREAVPEAAIYVLNGFPPGSAPAYRAADLRPVLGSRDEIAEWAAANRAEGVRRPAALHVDTGMNRLGLSVPEGLALAGDPVVAEAGFDLLMSHLVSAEVEHDPLTDHQAAEFARVREAYPGIRASLANSSGDFLPSCRADLARPGYALYGGNPQPGRDNPMRPVVRLEAGILQVREVAAGATAGYNARWTARGPRRLATLSLGYADGFPRASTGRGEAVVGGVRCPFVGNVSMDLIILDVTEAPHDALRRGAPATLIGDGLDLDMVGRHAGTIGYEILTNLGRRYERVYRG
ncbi:alanine racemase [Methylobacterium currus]|uniref:Alanine racemase n=1 Tax=Methylobacterium currus TaxID=2051553 RepID=A0A2R4WJ05_9HYPH|nr:alanine racemase [Methylobacterium currus]AWB21505.1 alanine racemase [Methylobacterium currus]UHC13733.1 alanine racemase [Methylobacterium currus]